MRTIWTRYALREIGKIFFLFLGAFYFLYVLVDYSARAKAFLGAGFINTLLYYLYQFTQRADLLIPIGLMLASIKVLTALNVRNELVAMVTGGVAIRRLLRPFLVVALLSMTFLYTNYQYLQPQALNNLATFENRFFHTPRKKNLEVQTLTLSDHSTLIYDHFDPVDQAFIDLFWLPSANVIYHCEALFPFKETPLGKEVDYLRRNEKGEVELIAHTAEKGFPSIICDADLLTSATTPPKRQSLTYLLQSLPLTWSGKRMHDREAELVTTLLYKLTIPLTCLLVIIAPAPFCLRFGRHLPIFMIYALSLFSLISFFTLVNSSVILAKSQVIPPLWAILSVFTLPLMIFGYRYAKL